MSPPHVWKLAHSRPLQVAVLVVTVLILTVFVTLSSQRDHRRRPRYGEDTGDNASDRINEIDGFVLSVCGQFRPREWHEQQRAFGCKSASPPPRISLDRAKSAKGATNYNQATVRNNLGDLSKQELPFYAHLVIERPEGDLDCAGTVVDYEYVVTTAKCAYGAKRIFVVLGTSNTEATQGVNTEADKWCYMKNYHPIEFPYPDIAVLRLKEAANYSDSIRAACIPQHIQPGKGAACIVARRKANNLASKLQGYAVNKQRCPAELPELYEPNCYQAKDDNKGFCELEQGTPVVCYDTCDKSSSRLQAFAVGMESFNPTTDDKCNTSKSRPIQYTDLTRKSELIRTMTHTMINITKYPTPDTIKCVDASS